MRTHTELIKLALQKKVKHYNRYKKHELEKKNFLKNIVKTNGKEHLFW